jgi:hypothetical protein
MTKQDDSRYPYTHACDFIRVIAGYNKGGTKISRADASRITSAIADILDMEHHDLACKIADAELGKTDEDRGRESRLALLAMDLLPDNAKI